MKQKIKFSWFSILFTASVLILFVVGTIMLLGNGDKLTLFCIIMGGVTIAGLYHCPISIEAMEFGVTLHSNQAWHCWSALLRYNILHRLTQTTLYDKEFQYIYRTY